MKQFIPEDGVYVYFRYNDDKTVMVVVNNNDARKELKPDRYAEMLHSVVSGRNIISGEVYPMNSSIVLEGKSANIFELSKN